MGSTEWPEPPAERIARKERIKEQRKAKRRQPAPLDLRTPSGKTLPY